MDVHYERVAASLADFQNQKLSIIRLSEPISTQIPNAHKRHSDASTDVNDYPSPASLAADLVHYKELFSKLRFSYLEQVTKEKFLRTIVGDPPQIVEHAENLELEQQLAIAKTELKAQKEEVADMVEAIEKKGQELSRCYDSIQLQSTKLEALPNEISSLEQLLSSLRATTTGDPNVDPGLNLPLSATQDLLVHRQAEMDSLNKQLKVLQQVLPRKSREAERLENELKPLEVQRAGTVAAADEARLRKEQGDRGAGDELELKGRWYRGSEMGLRDLHVVTKS